MKNTDNRDDRRYIQQKIMIESCDNRDSRRYIYRKIYIIKNIDNEGYTRFYGRGYIQ